MNNRHYILFLRTIYIQDKKENVTMPEQKTSEIVEQTLYIHTYLQLTNDKKGTNSFEKAITFFYYY